MRVIADILWGEDVGHEKEVAYADKRGRVTRLTLLEAFLRIEKDTEEAFTTVSGRLFPWMVDFRVGRENKRNHRNIERFDEAFAKALEKSSDIYSFYSILTRDGKLTPEEIRQDLKGLVMAGYDTSSRGAASALY